MEQNSNETPEATPVVTVPQTETVAEAAETAAATPRRRSRRATAATGETVAAPESAAAAEPAAEQALPADAAPADAAAVADEKPAPKKRATRSRKKAVEQEPAHEAPDAAEAPAVSDAEAPAATSPDAEASAVEGDAPAAPKRRATRSRKKPAAEPEAPAAETPAVAVADEPAEEPAAETTPAAQGAQSAQRGRGRNAQNRRQAAEPAEGADEAEKAENADRNGNGNGNAARATGDAGTRSSRTRQRERKRRGPSDDLEPEITEDDILLPVAGVLDVLDNYAFVRTSGYLPGTNDVYVSLGQVKKYGLRKGDAVVGAIRQPREGEGAGRQKYNAIVKIDAVNSRPVEEEESRKEFAELTPVNPDQRLRLETEREHTTQRVIDLFAPIGFGQRGLISGATGSGKTTTLQQIAAAVTKNHADAHLMMVLVDARPEEVTELQRSINGEVIASTFDRSAEDHATVAELAVERAKRLVELGHDVVLLLDSVTRLGRAYQHAAAGASRVAGVAFDVSVLAPVKRLLSAARNLENGGSLTILATANDASTSHTDELILEELEGVWNMQLRLVGELAAQRIYPAIDLVASSTRREELLTSESEVQVLNQIRREVAVQGVQAGLEAVLSRLAGTSSNVEFLSHVLRTKGLS